MGAVIRAKVTAIAAISPSPVLSVHSEFSAWYSSVRRTSNMVRNTGLPAQPPVATITPLRARIALVTPPASAATPTTSPRLLLKA